MNDDEYRSVPNPKNDDTIALSLVPRNLKSCLPARRKLHLHLQKKALLAIGSKEHSRFEIDILLVGISTSVSVFGSQQREKKNDLGNQSDFGES
ncbi:hypothetical protein BCON_0038g00130 [Botryotinia convoluta]|uniref:Uncharacterized protein n=1 Tax=Botryotinia convoluta TaxID=54673 RepID=A0A4Z1IF59_9HELO|nr:hypothetical protein BCON_0038g00130 [Botryotinia convoluta]